MFSPFRFQSTRPARGATRFITGSKKRRNISIHAPREGRDYVSDYGFQPRFHISIHAPREGRDHTTIHVSKLLPISIHAPREGRDVVQGGIPSLSLYFNPRAPRGARPPLDSRSLLNTENFNPRAPRGARLTPRGQRMESLKFQSTRPARGATYSPWSEDGEFEISIHAPREGRDIDKNKQNVVC